MSQIRSGAAEVRELDRQLAVALERPGIDQIRNGASGIKGVLVEPYRVLGKRQWIRRLLGMDEDVRAAAVEFLEQWFPDRVPEVGAEDV